MTRTETIAKVKELGITTEKPAHKTSTAVLNELIEKHLGATVTAKPKKEKVVKEAKELMPRGRKVNPTSARQLRIKAREALIAAGELKRGRKIDLDSDRQKRLAAMQAKIDQGIEIKRGRPAMKAV